MAKQPAQRDRVFFGEPTPPRWKTWSEYLLASRDLLLELLHTDDFVRLGMTTRSLADAYLTRDVVRASVHKVGPSYMRRFSFYKKALHVEEIQASILFEDDDNTSQGTSTHTRTLTSDDAHTDTDTPTPTPHDTHTDPHTHPHIHSDTHGDTATPAPTHTHTETRIHTHTPTHALRGGELATACLDLYRTLLGATNQGDVTAAGESHPFIGKRSLCKNGPEGEILRDVTRTFPLEGLFKESSGAGQNLLACVLRACLSFHDDVGYCQGMNFVVATFLFSLRHRLNGHTECASREWPHDEDSGYNSDHSTQTQNTEASVSPEAYKSSDAPPLAWDMREEHIRIGSDVFWAMTAVMAQESGLNMRMLWHPEVPHMKLRVFQFDRLMNAHAPKLHAHFRNIRLAPDILVTQWLMTLLAYCLPLRVLVRVWDVVFLDGWKCLFRICLALLQAVEEDLLPLSLEESGRFLRQWTTKRHPLWRDPKLLLSAAMRLKVTNSMLSSLTEEFYLTLLKEQLHNSTCGEWLMRYGPGTEGEMLKDADLARLKVELRSIEDPVATDLVCFRKKIEDNTHAHTTTTKRLDSLRAQLDEAHLQIEELEEATRALKAQYARMARGSIDSVSTKVVYGDSEEDEDCVHVYEQCRQHTQQQQQQQQQPPQRQQQQQKGPHTHQPLPPHRPPPPTPQTHTHGDDINAHTHRQHTRQGSDESSEGSIVSVDLSSPAIQQTANGHAHTHTDAHTHTRSDGGADARGRAYTHTHTGAHAHTDGCTQMGAHTHTHTDTHSGVSGTVQPAPRGSFASVVSWSAQDASITELMTRLVECIVPMEQPPLAPEKRIEKDLAMLEAKITQSEKSLCDLRVTYRALQTDVVEAQVALEEAEAYRVSLSDQLVMLLTDVESRVNRRMRDVVRARTTRHAVSAALSPNLQMLRTARLQRKLSSGSFASLSSVRSTSKS